MSPPLEGWIKLSVNSLQLLQIVQDEEYNRVVVPDEESFLKRHEAKIMIGYDEDKMVDGKVVPGVEI